MQHKDKKNGQGPISLTICWTSRLKFISILEKNRLATVGKKWLILILQVGFLTILKSFHFWF